MTFQYFSQGVCNARSEDPRKAGTGQTEALPHELPTANRQSSTDPAATPVPRMPQADLKAVIKDESVFITRGDRSYRIRSLDQNLSRNVMKVNVMAYRGEAFHMDVLNLYSAYHRSGFAKTAAKELGVAEEVIEKDLGKLLLKLEELQEQQIDQALTPVDPAVELSEAERAEALAFLHSPNLLDRILQDFETCGIVGEETNKLVGYLVAVSRKLPQPLGALIQSSSASGKTTTMDSILAFVPKEDLVKYSAITGQALYYKGENDLQHKIIAIVEEEGAEKASYPLKLLLSEGELIIASTGKNQTTGSHATQDYHVKGPVAVFVTTTAVETDEEFQNRCLVLTVDESRAQTQAIHKIQREKHTLDGLKRNLEKDRIRQVHQNAQRLLRPLRVVNPFAPNLTFLDDKTRMRRDQEKYLNLIDACAFLHQVQRTIRSTDCHGEKVDYIEATPADIETANRLAHEVLGRSLDELPPQTRKLLSLVHEMVRGICEKEGFERADVRFSRRDIREHVQWGNTQLKIHLKRLEEMEYLLVHRGKRGQSFEYELLYNGEGQDHKPFLMGLLEVERIEERIKDQGSRIKREKDGIEEQDHEAYVYDVKKSGAETNEAVPSRAQVGTESAPGRTHQNGSNLLKPLPLAAGPLQAAKNRELRRGVPG